MKVRDELRREFPQLEAEAAVVVFNQATPINEDPTRVEQLVADLQGAPSAASVVDPLTRPAEAGLISRDGRTALVPVQLTAENDAQLPKSAGLLIDHVDELSLGAGATAKATGEWPVWSDFNQTNDLSAPQGRAPVRSAHGPVAAGGIRVCHRGRPSADVVARRNRGRVRVAAPARRDHATVGVVHELLDDDRSRGGDRLQPVHRFPLPRGT